MIERTFETETARSDALYSLCGQYRFRLRRRWGAGRDLCWVMLNPSTATEARNDPTIERCERRARAMGFDGLAIVNLFAFRATRPVDLFAAEDPVGQGNADVVVETAQKAGLVVCGWGVHGGFRGQGAAMARDLRTAGCALTTLGLTRDGHPRHPLYVPYTTGPVAWPG
jgi:hypothetical protein